MGIEVPGDAGSSSGSGQVMAERQGEQQVVLVARPAAWGLATACPACLQALLHLKLAEVPVALRYTAVQPDSEDVPCVEYKGDVGFASETGGIVQFLHDKDVLDLDSGLNVAELADLRAYKEMVNSCLGDAVSYELWMKENEAAATDMYFVALPWPVNKALYWKQQRSSLSRLGFSPGEARSESVGEMYRTAVAAYQALSVRLQDKSYFFGDRPTSLDAAVLAHLLLVLRAPFAVSELKDEVGKHSNLVRYAETHANYCSAENVLAAKPNPSRPAARAAASMPGKSSKRSSTSSSSGNPRSDKGPKKTNEKEKMFRKRSKYFIVGQFISVVLYVVLVGIDYEDGMEDVGADDD